MLPKQALRIQLIVVSLHRPMIEAAQPIIGVTKTLGTRTLMIGLELRPTVRMSGHP
jgi:chromosome segregation ATPase